MIGMRKPGVRRSFWAYPCGYKKGNCSYFESVLTPRAGGIRRGIHLTQVGCHYSFGNSAFPLVVTSWIWRPTEIFFVQSDIYTSQVTCCEEKTSKFVQFWKAKSSFCSLSECFLRVSAIEILKTIDIILRLNFSFVSDKIFQEVLVDIKFCTSLSPSSFITARRGQNGSSRYFETRPESNGNDIVVICFRAAVLPE